MGDKQKWIIRHEYDVDGGYGDAVPVNDIVAVVEATDEEINAFLEKWDKPRVYDRPYDGLEEHHVSAEPIEIVKDISTVVPYDPETKDWPDIPYERGGIDFKYHEDTKEWTHRVFDRETGEFVTKTIKNEEDI